MTLTFETPSSNNAELENGPAFTPASMKRG